MSQDLDFFATAAQVIPVIFLALAVDLGTFVRSPLDSKMESWTDLRREREYVQIKAGLAVGVEAKKDELGRDLTPEEFFAINDEVVDREKADWDKAERKLTVPVVRARIAAAAFSAVAVLLLIVGEAVALRVLESGDASRTANGVVESTLWVGAWLVGWRVIDRLVSPLGAEFDWIARKSAWLTVGGSGVVLGVTYVVWWSF